MDETAQTEAMAQANRKGTARAIRYCLDELWQMAMERGLLHSAIALGAAREILHHEARL